MPFKSRAQRRKFAELLVKGEISPETFEEWAQSRAYMIDIPGSDTSTRLTTRCRREIQ